MSAPNDVPQRTGLNDYSAARCGKHVTVYCWSNSVVGTERWAVAERLGSALASRGWGVVTGGYCGSMEAVSKGAALTAPRPDTPVSPQAVALGETGHSAGCQIERFARAATTTTTNDSLAADSAVSQVSGVAVRGVLVPGQFPDRALKGNAFLTESMDARNMPHRLDVLSSLTRYYIVLPGTLGTLTELAIIWSLSVLHPRGLERPVILCWRDPWEGLVRNMCGALGIPADYESAIRYVDSVDESIALIEADYAECAAKAEKPAA